MTTTVRTYPAEFKHFDTSDYNVEDIPDPTSDQLACDWGNPQACLDDNEQRAAFAGLALKAYASRVGGGEDAGTVLNDLFNDLRHLCDALDLDFEDLAARDTAYQAELRGEF